MCESQDGWEYYRRHLQTMRMDRDEARGVKQLEVQQSQVRAMVHLLSTLDQILPHRGFSQGRRNKTNTAIGKIVFTKLGERIRTRSLATSCSPSSAKEYEHVHWQHRVHQAWRQKTNTVIGNILFTLFSRRCAHRKIWVCSYNGDASLLMLTITTHEVTFCFISACIVFLHCDTFGSVVDAKRM
jgi:hypothetical protein